VDEFPPPLHTVAGAGTRLGGRYRLEARIAAGGMATVWEGVDEVLARRVAVKVLHPHLAGDDQFVARFRREAVAAARLSHPAIVSIYDTCTDNGVEAIVMELVRGTTLRAELHRRGRFESAEAATVVAEIADALACAHEAGIVHRDVKPANVLLSTDGRVLVTDFGIAKAGDGLDLTGTNTTLGTAKYLAPEQVEGGAVDARADVYALGVILYELLCGEPPFVAEGEAATALARLQRDPVPPRRVRPDIAPAMEAVVLRALARDPNERFADAPSLRDAVRGAVDGLAPAGPALSATSPDATGGALDDATRATADPTRAAADPTRAAPSSPAPAPAPAPAPPEAEEPVRRARRRRRAPYAVGALVLAAVGTALVLISQSGDPGGAPPDETRPASEGGGLQIAALEDFDPGGDGEENGDRLVNLLDGDPETFWRTECYRSPSLAGLKPGVGLVVELSDSSAIGELVVDTRTPGWTAQVYVADSRDAWSDPADLGAPIGTIDGAPSGTTAVDLGGAEGSLVLLWLTGFGADPSPDCEANPHGVTLTGLSVVES
jgi:tRNA A-37 threonylcarbamoyl transferase component Bud32